MRVFSFQIVSPEWTGNVTHLPLAVVSHQCLLLTDSLMGKVWIHSSTFPYICSCRWPLVNRFDVHIKVIWSICHLNDMVLHGGGFCLINVVISWSLLLNLGGGVYVCCVLTPWILYILWRRVFATVTDLTCNGCVLNFRDNPKFQLFF